MTPDPRHLNETTNATATHTWIASRVVGSTAEDINSDAMQGMWKGLPAREMLAGVLPAEVSQHDRQCAEALALSERTLERFRVSGVGPKFVRMGKSIRYRLSDVDARTTTARLAAPCSRQSMSSIALRSPLMKREPRDPR